MAYNPGELRQRSQQLVTARKWGISLITGVLGLGLLFSEIDRLQGSLSSAVSISYLALFVTTGFLIFAWVWSSQKEMDLLFEWLDPQRYEPPSSFTETAIILGFACLLVAMLFASRDPFLFGCIFAAYSIAQIPTHIHITGEIGRAIGGSRNRLMATANLAERDKFVRLYGQGVDVLENYYLTRPQRARGWLIAGGAVLGLLLALLARISRMPFVTICSYLAFLATIIISEVAIFRWRALRDTALRPLAAELRDLKRTATVGEQTNGREP